MFGMVLDLSITNTVREKQPRPSGVKLLVHVMWAELSVDMREGRKIYLRHSLWLTGKFVRGDLCYNRSLSFEFLNNVGFVETGRKAKKKKQGMKEV